MKRIYIEDPYCTSNRAVVTAVDARDGLACFSCDESVFFAENGGQPSDRGTVSCGGRLWNVTAAFDKGLDTDVWHMSDAPEGTFAVGDEVELTIDWDYRFANMQRHCGEHMLSGTFHTLFGGVNKGFHMGEEYITVDIDLDGRMLSDEEVDLAERTVNDAIWADLPVNITYFENYEASLVMPVRKQVPHDGEVSVVTVGELPDPYDCIACCGTHPSSSAQVGLLAIYKHENNKGMNRIYFDCGFMAHEKLTSDYRLLTEIANSNSCSTGDLMHKLEAAEEQTSALKVQLAGMSAYIREEEQKVIADKFAKAEAENRNSVIHELDIISVEDLLKLGFSAMEGRTGKLLILLHPADKTALLYSGGEAKYGDLVRENAAAFNGKGGGRPDNARAVFGSEKDMRAFAESIAEMV